MLDLIKNYFEHIPSAHRALLLAGGISFFWLVEIAVPLFNFKYNKIKHAGLNFFFTFTTIVINFLFALVMVKLSDWTKAKRAKKSRTTTTNSTLQKEATRQEKRIKTKKILNN